MVKLSARQVLNHDKALRRTAYKRLRGISGPFVDVTQLLEASAAWDQVSEPVQEAFLSDSRLSQLRESKEDERVKQLQSSLF